MDIIVYTKDNSGNNPELLINLIVVVSILFLRLGYPFRRR